MKTYILTSILSLMLLSSEISAAIPGNDLPDRVDRSLTAKYPDVKVKDWRYEDNACIVRFVKDKNQYEAVFERDGSWIRTSRIIKVQQLPKAVHNNYKAGQYTAWHVESTREVEFNGFNDVLLYEVKVSKGDEGYSLFYDEAGQMVMKTFNLQLRVATN